MEGERDHAKKMEAVQKEVADNQTWHVQKLKDWRDTVTLALQRPGGARFEDVPGHIKALVKEHDTLRQLVEALPVVDVESLADYNHMLMTSPIDEPLKNLIRYRATLDATTPAAAINERCSYCQKPLTTNHRFSYGFPGVSRVYKCDRAECIPLKGGDGE